jgi:hypothetical protein
MVEYSERERQIIQHFEAFEPRKKDGRTKYQQYLDQIPKTSKRYKCYDCFKILSDEELIDDKCPICKSAHMLVEMCPLDHNGCGHEISGKIEYCPVCGEPICPACGDHNVATVSRVTGYLSDVAGWNNAKRAELKDRVRSELNQNNELVFAKV